MEEQFLIEILTRGNKSISYSELRFFNCYETMELFIVLTVLNNFASSHKKNQEIVRFLTFYILVLLNNRMMKIVIFSNTN